MAQVLQIYPATHRPDRLVQISGSREFSVLATFSIDGGTTWTPATIYPGENYDQWRGSGKEKWNDAALKGILPAGDVPCVWNYFYDVDLDLDGKNPFDNVRLRLCDTNRGRVLLEDAADLSGFSSITIADHRNIAQLAGGTMPGRWTIKTNETSVSGKPSIFMPVERIVRKLPDAEGTPWEQVIDPDVTPLALDLKLTGWYRVYVGMESFSTVRVYFSGDDVWYELPNPAEPDLNSQSERIKCLKQDYFIRSCDMTGQKLSLMAGGSRHWRDVSVRYVRLVPMDEKEVAEHHRLRDLAETQGRRFAGYLEPVTTGWYEPPVLTLRNSLHNEMRLNAANGATEVYVHVIRIGCKAWYHSDVVDRFSVREDECKTDPGAWNFQKWMEEGDTPAMAIEEGRAAGVKVFIDAGMNCTYCDASAHYSLLTGEFAKQHPEYLCPDWKTLFDYRIPAVQDYVVSIVRELLIKYGPDGVHLDFSRFGFAKAYDLESLINVLRRIHAARCEAERKWKHPITLAARVDYELPPAAGSPEPLFLSAVRTWAKEGLIDRITPNLDGNITADIDFRHYRETLAGTKTELWGDLYWGTWQKKDGGPARDVAIARQWAKNGITGGFHYYMAFRPIEWNMINWQLRLIETTSPH